MTRNTTPSQLPSMVGREPSNAAVQPIRRYRLSKLRLDARIAGSASRFDHLKRTYD